MVLRMSRPRIATAEFRTAKPPPKLTEAFYVSPEWRALLAEIIKERGRRCEDAECPTPHGPWKRIIGDHIKERRDGGAPLDKRNVMLRCDPCHGRKTAIERARRAGIRS